MPIELQNNQSNVLQFVHITDTHLLNQSEDSFNGLNTKNTLELVLSHIQSSYADIDFLLLTGDVSQTGDKKSYQVLKTVIHQYEFPIYCVPGNHDTPDFLQQISPNSPNNSVNIIQFHKFSLILLDSCIENKHHGIISQNCLHYLDDYLQDNPQLFNIFAIHHPPVSINSKWLDELGLLNKSEFLSVIEKHSKESLALFGHVHQEFDQQIGNLRLLSTPSTCYQFKAHSATMQCLSTPPPAYRYIKLFNSNNHTFNIHTEVHYIDETSG